LWHSLNGAATVLPQPGVDVLRGGGAPLVSGADPPFARHKGGNGGRVGVQDAGPVCQLHFGLVAADLLNDHGVSVELIEVYRVSGRSGRLQCTVPLLSHGGSGGSVPIGCRSARQRQRLSAWRGKRCGS